MKVNVLYFNDAFYQYPAGVSSLDAFMRALSACRTTFIRLVRYDEENCVYPYFIAEDTRPVYVNVLQIIEIEEDVITILPRAEYDRRLLACIQEHCLDCAHYEEDWSLDDLAGHRDKLCLNGECAWKEPI